jgi:hypothetical protein
MADLGSLLGHDLVDPLVGMPERSYRDAGGEVEVFPPGRVGQLQTLAVREEQRGTSIGVEQVVRLGLDQGFGSFRDGRVRVGDGFVRGIGLGEVSESEEDKDADIATRDSQSGRSRQRRRGGPGGG